jgi:hypothetical protein
LKGANKVPDLRIVPPSGGDDGGDRPFHEHPLALALWNAIHGRPASSYAEIALRMSAALGRHVSWHMVNNVIYHVRKHADQYGWSVPHVKCGRGDKVERQYFTILADPEQNSLRRIPEHRLRIRDGGTSRLNAISTMAENLTKVLEMAAEIDGNTASQKRRFRAAASMVQAASETAQRALESLALVQVNGTTG